MINAKEYGNEVCFDFAYERCNRDLDPQLVWLGKDEQDGLTWSSTLHHFKLVTKKHVQSEIFIASIQFFK